MNIIYVIGFNDLSIVDDAFIKIKEFCNINKITFYEKKFLDTIGNIINENVDIRFTIGWKYLIQDTKNLIVIHDSLLPKYRGFSPVVNALINGEKKLGATAIYATKNYDEGDIIDHASFKISYPIKVKDVINQMSFLYLEIIKNILKKHLFNGRIRAIKQNNSVATYSPWLDDSDYIIDWSWDIKKIIRFIDAVGEPYNGAITYYGTKKILIKDATEIRDKKIVNRERHVGKILYFHNNFPIIICKKGLLKLNQYFNPDGSPIKLNLRTRFNDK